MAAPCSGTCGSWSTVEATKLCLPCADVDDDTLERTLSIASDLLYQLSGRQFSGSCLDTVRPCARCESFNVLSASYWWGSWDWNAGWGFCSCNRPRDCGCSRLSEITLGTYPVTSIVEVLVADDSNPDWLSGAGTAILDPTLYRVDDYRYLVRLPNPDGSSQGWPRCQRLDLPTTESDTFSVELTYGILPPSPGIAAAEEWACQMALACVGSSECRLPQRVQSITRQGVSMVMLDPMAFLEAGRTGLYLVDTFLAAYNKNGLKSRASVLSPNMRRRVRRTDTGVSSGS